MALQASVHVGWVLTHQSIEIDSGKSKEGIRDDSRSSQPLNLGESRPMSSEERVAIATGYFPGDTTGYISDFLKYSLAKDDREPFMYYFAIVASACRLESVLEDHAYHWCKSKSNSDDPFLERLMKKIGDDVNHATGLERWKSWLRACGQNASFL